MSPPVSYRTDSFFFFKKKMILIIDLKYKGAQPAETLQLQFSGYGANLHITQMAVDKSGVKDPLDTWTDETISKVVDAFLDVRFPTVIVESNCTAWQMNVCFF
jgi:hypothetical protein